MPWYTVYYAHPIMLLKKSNPLYSTIANSFIRVYSHLVYTHITDCFIRIFHEVIVLLEYIDIFPRHAKIISHAAIVYLLCWDYA